MGEQWIVIPNWDKFQHYKDRSPLWIKLYTELNSDPSWELLTLYQRGLLVSIWIEYARARGRLRLDLVRRWVGAGFKMASIEALNHAGFLELSASRPPEHSASLEVEKRREREEKGDALARKPAKNKIKNAQNWIRNGLAAEVPPEHLAEVIADEFKLTEPTLIGELVAQALEARQ